MYFYLSATDIFESVCLNFALKQGCGRKAFTKHIFLVEAEHILSVTVTPIPLSS